MDLNPRLPEKMRRRLEEQAHDIEAHLTEQDFSHFHLQFHGSEERDRAWQAVKYLDEAYNDLGSRFGKFPEEHIPVIIFIFGKSLFIGSDSIRGVVRCGKEEAEEISKPGV